MKVEIGLESESIILVPENIDDVTQLHCLTLMVMSSRIKVKAPTDKDKQKGIETYIAMTIDRKAAAAVVEENNRKG